MSSGIVGPNGMPAGKEGVIVPGQQMPLTIEELIGAMLQDLQEKTIQMVEQRKALNRLDQIMFVVVESLKESGVVTLDQMQRHSDTFNKMVDQKLRAEGLIDDSEEGSEVRCEGA